MSKLRIRFPQPPAKVALDGKEPPCDPPTLLDIPPESKKTRSMPPRKIKVKKQAEDTSDGSSEDKISVIVKSFEKKFDILEVEDVEIVHVVLFEHGGKTYYREPNKNKLFTRIGPKSIGPYIGRWDPRKETILTDIPNSDTE